jgi:hypothetical protein
MADIQQSCGAQLPSVLTKQEAAHFLRCTPRYLERQSGKAAYARVNRQGSSGAFVGPISKRS